MAQSVQFFQPGTEGAIDYGQIQRQRALAEMLQKQGMTPQQGQMVSGHYVAPSPLSYVAQLAQVLAGKHKENQADEREQTLLRSVQAQRSKEAQDFMTASNGTPAVPGRSIAPLTPNDDEGNAMPSADVAGQAAVAPDRNRALAIALQSQNPALQGMGGKMMERQMDAEELKAALASAGIGAPAGGAPAASGEAPGASAPGGGGIPGIDPRAMALTLSRLPQAQKLGGMIQDTNKPQTLAPGGTAWSPTGGALYTAPQSEPGIQVRPGAGPGAPFSAEPVQGYASAKAAQEAAIAQAKGDQELKTINVGGVDVTKTVGQWRQQAGGGTTAAPAPAVRAPAASPVGPGYAGGSASAAAGGQMDVYTAELQKAQQEFAAAQQKGDAAGASRAQADMAGIQREMGRLPGGGRGTPPAAPGGGIVGQDPAAAEYDKTRAKNFAEKAATVQTTGSQARGTLANLGTLEALYKDPNVAAGGAAENISGLKNLAASAGVSIKGLGAEQAIEAITNDMALKARSTADGGGMPGNMTDSDRKFLTAMQPGLSKTPEGRALIISVNRAIAQRQIATAEMANEYERTHGRIDVGFERQMSDFAAKNPMFAGMKPPTAPSAGGAADYRSLAAQELERRRKGAK